MPSLNSPAPVRRETRLERAHRVNMHQIPPVPYLLFVIEASEKPKSSITINRDLEPGKAKFVKDPIVP